MTNVYLFQVLFFVSFFFQEWGPFLLVCCTFWKMCNLRKNNIDSYNITKYKVM